MSLSLLLLLASLTGEEEDVVVAVAVVAVEEDDDDGDADAEDGDTVSASDCGEDQKKDARDESWDGGLSHRRDCARMVLMAGDEDKPRRLRQ